MKDPTNATAEQKAKAKEELKRAREAVKKAYGDAGTYWKEAIEKFLRILGRSVKELGEEAVSGLNRISTFKKNKTAFKSQNNILIPFSSEESSYLVAESTNVVDESMSSLLKIATNTKWKI